jgi:hypothetical protein
MVEITYTNTSMVKKEHINEIERQLIKLGSALPQGIDNAENRALRNILRLATGDGLYKLSPELINTISSKKFGFKIKWE